MTHRDTLTTESEQLSRAISLLDDLVGLTSYSEIVGGISVNSGRIRTICDEASAFLAEIQTEPMNS
jgi:hypothetical protein